MLYIYIKQQPEFYICSKAELLAGLLGHQSWFLSWSCSITRFPGSESGLVKDSLQPPELLREN